MRRRIGRQIDATDATERLGRTVAQHHRRQIDTNLKSQDTNLKSQDTNLKSQDTKSQDTKSQDTNLKPI